ncbi:MAG: hypothetical protein LBD91_03095 [Prevotellaceae bacterium]|jgi:hypothetical protein|nr:hypothetical protein [Prevotellaceae bacterium]
MGTTTQQTAAQKAAAKAAKAAESQAAKAGESQAAKSGESKDAIFEANPRLDLYYSSSDGAAFYTQNAAELHAATLPDKTVKRITR